MRIDEILHLLAKRIKPNFSFLGDAQWIDENPNYSLYCLICDKVIVVNYITSDIRNSAIEIENHGLNHLKEKGLLAFI